MLTPGAKQAHGSGTTIHIRAWRPRDPLASNSLTEAALVERLADLAELKDAARARLARRIMSRCLVTFALRPDVDPQSFVVWLTELGAVVTLS